MASVEVSGGKRPHVKTEKMQEYMRSHGDGGSQKVYRCPVIGCEKVLTSAPGLKYHIKSHNGPERPFLCDRCHKTFKSANGLKYHCEKTKCDCSQGTAWLSQGTAFPDQLSDDEEATTDFSFEFGSSADILPLGYPQQSLLPLGSPQQSLLPLGSPQQSLLPLGSPQRTLTIPCPSTQEGDITQVDRLTELAIIATSPQSPLMQKTLPIKIDQASRSSVSRSLEKALQPTGQRPSDCSPPWSSSSQEFLGPFVQMSAPSSVESLPSEEHGFERDAIVTSSSPFPSHPQDEPTATWTHSWPTAVWQCFIKDCKIKFLSDCRGDDWQTAQYLASHEKLTSTATQLPSELQTISYGEKGLRLMETVKIEIPDGSDGSLVQLHLTPDLSEQGDILAQCPVDHPFFVKHKGWSSLEPSRTAAHYGIPCRELKINDICLPPSHPEATFTDDVFKSFQSHAFTSMDTSAVFALSNMKKQRLDQELSPKHTPDSPGKRSPTKYSFDGDSKKKRPMNSFMLFAKKYRMELTQKFPGKDNRAISCMLGDKWKSMKTAERDQYAQEAKVLADEQKKINPDCWKRKRSTTDPP